MSSTDTEDEFDLLPPQKRPRKNHFSLGEKHIILNVYRSVAQDNPTSVVDEITKKVANATGVCSASVYRILREYRQNKSISAPKVTRQRTKIIDAIDDFDKNAIRRKIHEFFLRNEIPTIDKVLNVINNDEDLPTFKRTTFYKLLKDINFRYSRRGRDSMLLDKEDIALWRGEYLRTIRNYRSEGRKFYYLDELWIPADYTKHCIEKDMAVTSSTGTVFTKKRFGKSKHLIICHIGSENGFVPDALWILQPNKSSEHCGEINCDSFETWFQNVLPQLEDNSVIIMDNAPYHSRKVEDTKSVCYIVDELAKLQNQIVLRLPPYHSELNPIELIWAQMRKYVIANKASMEFSDAKDMYERAVRSVTPEYWRECISHVEVVVEKQMWDLHHLMEKRVKTVVSNGNTDTSGSSEEW